jgi:hypothetical protein
MLRRACYASSMFRAKLRLLLAAALVMVIEMACSHAPAPSTNPEVHDTAKSFKSTGGVARFHLVDGTTYATNDFTVSDTLVVINVILRDSKYYGPTSEHFYGKSDVAAPPANVQAPVRIPMRDIRAVEKWEERVVSNDSKKGWLITGAVLALLVAALVVVIVQNND